MRAQTIVRRGLHVVMLALAALVLAGCVRVEMDLELHSDDTVDGVVVFAFSDELARVLDPETVWDEMGSGSMGSLPETTTSEPYAEDGYTGTLLTFNDSPFAEMTAVDDEDALRITRDGDELVVTGTMDLTGSNNPFGDLGASLGENLEFRIAITFPGEVVEHTGTLIGRTVVWEPRAGERTVISARGSAGPGGAAGEGTAAGGADQGSAGAVSATGRLTGRGGLAWLPIVAGAVVVIGLVALIAGVFLVLRAKNAQPIPAVDSTHALPTAYPQPPASVTHRQAPTPEADPQPGEPSDRDTPTPGPRPEEPSGPTT